MGQPSARDTRRPVRFFTAPTGARIAYAHTGRGKPLLVPAAWISHLELLWQDRAYRDFFTPLSAVRTVVQYDRPGCGLSDQMPGPAGLAADLTLLEALADHLGLERFDLLGISLGAPVSIAFGALFPQRVDRLILYGGYADGSDVAAPGVRTAMLGMIRAHWGLGSEMLADIFIPDADAATRALFTRLQKEAASPELAADLLAQCYEIDVTDLLDRVGAPTLVVHRRGDRAIPYRAGRALAARIPGARLISLPGRSHFPHVGDAAAVVHAILEFLGHGTTALPPEPPDALTARQLQVAALVAEGMTNRQIAQRLGIEERSAEGHVERIRLRLGVSSRAQVAAWWARSVSAGPAPDVEVPD